MKKTTLVLSIIMAVFSFIACNSQTTKAENESLAPVVAQAETTEVTKSTEDLKVYYFHFTRRCVTCTSVENITKDVLEKDFKNTIPFESVNLDEEEGLKLAKKLNVSGQTLLIIGNDQNINLTNFAFLNAKNKPEALKAKLIETIDNIKKQ